MRHVRISAVMIGVLAFWASHAGADTAGNLQVTLLKAKPAVVHVFALVKGVIIDPASGDQVWGDQISGGAGTGFIVNPDGYVATAGHVIEPAHESNEDLMKATAVIKFIQTKVIPQIEAQEKKTFSEAERRQLVGKLYEKYKDFKVILKKELMVVLSNRKAYPARSRSTARRSIPCPVEPEPWCRMFCRVSRSPKRPVRMSPY